MQSVYALGIPFQKINTLYTHTNLKRLNFYFLSRCRRIFVISQSELYFLLANEVPKESLIHFPIGINLGLFKDNYHQASVSKDIDVVFSLSVPNFSLKSHYYYRKRYSLVIKIINLLVKENLKVIVIGSNWNNSPDFSLPEEVVIDDSSYPNYINSYRRSKLFCMPSLLEGSPTGLAEALASNCYVVSSPTGWALDLLPSNEFGIDLVPLQATSHDWFNTIVSNLHTDITPTQYTKRFEFLDSVNFSEVISSFESL